MHDWFDPSRLGNSGDPLTVVDMHTAGEPVRILDMAGLDLGDSDVFLSVIGGLRLTDPAADLAVAAALASASLDRPIPAGIAFAAELGLGGIEAHHPMQFLVRYFQ